MWVLVFFFFFRWIPREVLGKCIGFTMPLMGFSLHRIRFFTVSKYVPISTCNVLKDARISCSVIIYSKLFFFEIFNNSLGRDIFFLLGKMYVKNANFSSGSLNFHELYRNSLYAHNFFAQTLPEKAFDK